MYSVASGTFAIHLATAAISCLKASLFNSYFSGFAELSFMNPLEAKKFAASSSVEIIFFQIAKSKLTKVSLSCGTKDASFVFKYFLTIKTALFL
ncbi:MAG: hypothetical protein LBF15_06625 [Candidatus Peribacteria bacterium]|nr:hypothetical protein [Candidatus Peribacteria bacterium]